MRWMRCPGIRCPSRTGHRPRPWPDHYPHHPGNARAGGAAVPARQPGTALESTSVTCCNPVSAAAALGVASPAAERASAADLAGHVRQQWAIESLHWLRDTLYQEDKSQVRTRSGPRIMAALRNLAICALRLFGCTDVTEATRWAARSMDPPFTILGLTS